MADFNLVGRIRPVYKGVWNIDNEYTVLETVINSVRHTAYIAIRDVPAGVELTNAEYWGVLADVSDLQGANGADGKDGGYIIPSVTATDDGYINFSFTPSDPDMDVIIMDKLIQLPEGPAGPAGAAGPQGERGEDGVGIDSIEVHDSAVTGGENRVTIRLTDGTSKSFGVQNGSDGKDGARGATGPAGPAGVGIASIDTIVSTVSGGENITTVTLTDGSSQIFSTFNGKDGAAGINGISPDVSVRPIDGGNRVSIWSASGNTSFDVMDGAAGQKGADGSPGPAGSDGVGIESVAQTVASSASSGINKFRITLTDGSSSEISIRNGERGETGEDGKNGLDATPVTPLFANSIDECADTTKLYVLPDGFIYAYMYQEATGPNYTNLAGAVTYDRRLSSSGKASSSAMTGACYTGFIPVKQGQIVRVKNLDMFTDFSSSAFPYVCFYTGASEDNVVSSTTYVRPADLRTEFSGVESSPSGDVVTWTAFKIQGGAQHSLASSITHIRISGKYFADKEIIVTVDEEITDGGGAGGYAWASTGHAFVPADYEAQIVALQTDKADKKAIPTKLPNPNALTIDGVEYDGSAAVNIETQSGGNILYGKKWVACGDSFTHGGYNASDGFDESVYIYQDGRFAGKNKVYPYIIGLRNNMNIVNLATGGQTMAASSNSFMTRYSTIDADADYITIMLGINDKVQGLAVGTLTDSTSSTFCGAFNIAMEHILENHPFAHIGIMVSNGTNAEIMEATRGIAERWGVPYLDFGSSQVPLMNRYTGRNVCAKAQEIREKNFCVISDGITPTNSHPNTAAHEYESTFIEAWLRTL